MRSALRFVWANHKGHGNGPSAAKPRVKRGFIGPLLAHRLGHGHYYPVNFNLTGASAVSGLVIGRRPSHIVWEIALIIVDAIQRHTWRAASDIRDEIVETVSPPIAYGDAAPPVVVEIPIFRVQASLFQCSPRVVFMRFVRASVAVSRWIHFAGMLDMQTPATFCVSGQEVGPANNRLFRARTLTQPA